MRSARKLNPLPECATLVTLKTPSGVVRVPCQGPFALLSSNLKLVVSSCLLASRLTYEPLQIPVTVGEQVGSVTICGALRTKVSPVQYERTSVSPDGTIRVPCSTPASPERG